MGNYQVRIVERGFIGNDRQPHHAVKFQGETQANSPEEACNNIWFQAAIRLNPRAKGAYHKLQRTQDPRWRKRYAEHLSDAVGRFRKERADFGWRCEFGTEKAQKPRQGTFAFETFERKLDKVLREFEDSKHTTCIAVFRKTETGHEVLAALRKADPAAGQWALPGGHGEPGESSEQTAIRELQEETGVAVTGLVPVKTREASPGSPKKDYVFAAFVDSEKTVMPSDDVGGLRWIPIDNLPAMAFGDDDVVRDCVDVLINKF